MCCRYMNLTQEVYKCLVLSNEMIIRYVMCQRLLAPHSTPFDTFLEYDWPAQVTHILVNWWLLNNCFSNVNGKAQMY